MRLFLAVLAVSGAALAVPAKQSTCQQKILECRQYPITRAGLIVEINRCTNRSQEASIYRPGMTDKPVLEGVLKVQQISSHRMGAPMQFKGTDFDLSVNMTTRPTPDGQHRGFLTSQRRGLKKAVVTCGLP